LRTVILQKAIGSKRIFQHVDSRIAISAWLSSRDAGFKTSFLRSVKWWVLISINATSSVTAHKVEVNPNFQNPDVPDNVVESAQKMFTPQLYEQLPNRDVNSYLIMK
jgi:hypothetical protein